MKMQIVVVRDIKANCFGQPNFVPNLGSSIRAFGDQCQDEKAGVLFQHPEDFELYHIGEYDDGTGHIEMIDKQQIATGSNYKR